jgi:hypothetical protein
MLAEKCGEVGRYYFYSAPFARRLSAAPPKAFNEAEWKGVPKSLQPYEWWECEYLAVYVAMMWRMGTGLQRLFMPAHHTAYAKAALDQTGDAVEWELRPVQHRRGGSSVSPEMVRVRSSAVHAPHLFAANDLVDALATMKAAMASSDIADLSMFAVQPGVHRREQLLATLRDDVRPTLSTLLMQDEWLAHLHVDLEDREPQFLLLLTPGQYEANLRDIIDEYEQRAQNLEQRLHTVDSPHEYLASIHDCLAN